MNTLSPLALFRAAYSLGSQKNCYAKVNIEALHSIYTSHRLGEVEENRLKACYAAAKEKLKAFKAKLAEEKAKLEEISEFLFPKLSQETDEIYEERMAKKPPLGDLDTIQRRLLAAGKFKDMKPAERDALFNEIVEKRKEYMQIEPFIYGAAENNLSTLEANLQAAKRDLEAFKKKDIPKSEDSTTQRIFETILHLQDLLAKEDGDSNVE